MFRRFGKLNETIVADCARPCTLLEPITLGKYIPGPSASMMINMDWSGDALLNSCTDLMQDLEREIPLDDRNGPRTLYRLHEQSDHPTT
jgi:hypothetical protein